MAESCEREHPHRVRFLNSHIDNVSRTEALSTIKECLDGSIPGYMVSFNTDICVKLEHDEEFRKAHEDATLVLMDSQPLTNLARRWGIPIKEKLAGSDLMPIVCEWAASEGFTCYILGGMPGVPEQAASNLALRFPGLNIAGTLSPALDFEKSASALESTIAEVARAQPDILFVCFGAPKSEIFMHRNLDALHAGFCLAVGAAVDFEAGNMRRAPLWMRRIGMEWFYRFLQEPRRLFKRYFVDSWTLLHIIRKHGRGGRPCA